MNQLEKAYEELDTICEKIMEERGSLTVLLNWDYSIDRQVVKIDKLGGTREKVMAIIKKYHVTND